VAGVTETRTCTTRSNLSKIARRLSSAFTDQALRYGLHIFPEINSTIEENPQRLMHDSRGKPWFKLYRQEARSWKRTDGPVVHESVLERVNSSTTRQATGATSNGPSAWTSEQARGAATRLARRSSRT
jgi:hypothetical protein